MSDTSKIDSIIERIHIIAEGDEGEPGVQVDGFAVTSGNVAAQRIEQYASRHGVTLYDVAQAIYWPTTSAEHATRRNIARIVARALGV